jgi:hypothetical protein
VASRTKTFERLLREGRIALKSKDRDLAHELWREAAMLNPYSEQVWLALLEVIDAPEDRRVCLQNIVEINPMNTQARRMLRAYEARDAKRAQQRRQRSRDVEKVRQRRRILMWRALGLGILLGVSGLFFGIVLSILLYAA